MKNKKFKKISTTLHFFVILLILFGQIKTADAITVGSVMGVGSPSAFADDILSDLGVDKDQLRYFTQSFNVSSQKKTPPSVSLFFNPSDPEDGEKVTVTASPTYFMNDPKNLYFTWFLKHKNDNGIENHRDEILEETVDCDGNGNCDLNGDDKIDISDYKIQATRIIVNGGFVPEENIYDSQSDNDGYEAVSGGDDQRGKNAECYVHNIKTGEEYKIDCGEWNDNDDNNHERHLFPNAPGDTTGDNSFGRDEEEFWRTDPNSNDTANLGNPDEANVAGLGVVSFTWNYQKGDQVGVVVEGISTEPTQTEDSTYKTMWAMSKKNYDFDNEYVGTYYPHTEEISTTTVADTDPLNPGGTITTIRTSREEIDEDEKGFPKIINGVATIKTTTYTQTITRNSSNVIILNVTVQDPYEPKDAETYQTPNPTYSTVRLSHDDFDIENDDIGDIKKPSDLNEFLYDALVSPQENSTGSNKLNINLSYSPTNPINDSSGKNSDILTISSSIPNAKDNNYLQYQWEVFMTDEINPNEWGGVETPKLIKSDLKESTQSAGLGIDTFKFKLALENPKKYLRVLLTVTENIGEKYARKNTQDVIIPISSIDTQINAYNAIASISSDNSFGLKLNLGNELCNDPNRPTDKAICPASKSQIVGLSVPDNFTDLLWTVDGKPLSYSECFFDGCDPEKQTSIAYFPVLKEVGDQYLVNLTAVDKDGKKVNLTRTFKVVDPQIEIISANTNICKSVQLGSYIDVDGKTYPDLSKLNFGAYNNSNIQIAAQTTGFSISPQYYSWNVDGDPINYSNASAYGYKIDNNGILILPPKEARESYSISVGALYTQDNLTKKALKNIWNVTYDQFYEKSISDDAIITFQDPESSSSSAQDSTKKIFASIYSSTPAYLAFLLRIVLTVFLFLFTVNLVFSFSPKQE